MAPTFLQQQLFPTLRLGIKAGTTHNRLGLSVHCRQGGLDRACGLHAAAMALTLLGRITHATSLTRRRRGVAARLWKAAENTYFNGVDEVGLAEILESLNTKLQITRIDGNHRATLAFAKMQLEQGGLAITSIQSKDKKTNHWLLVLGIESRQNRGTFTPTALLVMDPGQSEPLLCGFNGRLQLTSRTIHSSPMYIDYVTNDGATLSVTLTGAVGIRDMK